ncbi:MAG: aminoacyl-tRNA deacylase [Candidatus Nanohaloarchaea archaeon]
MNYFTQSTEELEEFLDFIEEDLENVRRAINSVKEKGLEPEFLIHAKSETVDESAENTDVDKSRIIKTLIFMADEPVAVLCPGDTSVSEEKLEEIIGSDTRMANPSEVEDSTGYKIGGVSPFDLDIPVIIEEELMKQEKVRPAAGSRVLGVLLDPGDLKELTDGKVVDVAR